MFGRATLSSEAITYAALEDSGLKQAVIRLIERVSGQRRLVRLYQEARRGLRPGDDIFGVAVRSLDLRLRCNAERLATVPRTGPLVVVANHPFGVVDGLVLCHLAAQVRPDFKVVAMSTLCRVPEVRDHVLPINFANTREAVATSARSRAAARAHLRAGGCLVIFPAGGVSTAENVFGPAIDAPWHPFAGRLVQGAEAAVLPVRFAGQNSRLFQLVSRISPTLRLSLLMGEARSRIGSEVRVQIGDVLPYDELRAIAAPKALVEHLRQVTHAIPLPAPARATRLHALRGTRSAGIDGTRRPNSPPRGSLGGPAPSTRRDRPGAARLVANPSPRSPGRGHDAVIYPPRERWRGPGPAPPARSSAGAALPSRLRVRESTPCVCEPPPRSWRPWASSPAASPSCAPVRSRPDPAFASSL